MPTTQRAITYDHGAVRALEELFKGPDGLIRPVPAADVEDFDHMDISAFCTLEGIYQLPTTELIEWLRAETDGYSTIEIGAGQGQVGRHIPVTMTDSYIQEDPEIRKIYDDMNTKTVLYGPDVVKMEAGAAITHYKPQVILGCWVTQFGESEKDRKASFSYGIREMNFKGRIERYIMVGNANIHRHKKILQKIPYRSHRFDWLYSRASSQAANVIYDFNFKHFL